MKLLASLLVGCGLLLGADLNIYYDLDIATSKAKKEKKNIILYIYSTNCPWCKKMDKNTYKNIHIIDELNKNYVFVKLNRDIDKIPEEFMPRFVPTTYILNKNQEEEFAMYGYKNADEFLLVLEDSKKDF